MPFIIIMILCWLLWRWSTRKPRKAPAKRNQVDLSKIKDKQTRRALERLLEKTK